MLSKTDINTIFRLLKKNIPEPTTELIYSTPFELLIAVILSAQATDVGVNKATKVLFAHANTPEAIITLGLTKLKKYIKTIGLFNTKASNIMKTCKILISEFASQVPRTRQELESLPGVGRKTANVILNTVFNEPTIAVDTHIFRLANRLQIATGTTPLQVEEKLLQVVPKKYLMDAHHLLILHGRYVCKARKPLCGDCYLSSVCPAFTQNI